MCLALGSREISVLWHNRDGGQAPANEGYYPPSRTSALTLGNDRNGAMKSRSVRKDSLPQRGRASDAGTACECVRPRLVAQADAAFLIQRL
jgi:hypothetical protein